MILTQILLSAVLPALAVVLAIVLVHRPWRNPLQAGRLRGLGPGLGAAYLVGHLAILGWPALPPLEAAHWLPLIAIAGGALGLTLELARGRSWLRFTLTPLLLVGVVLAVLWPLLGEGLGTLGSTLWLGGAGAALTALWLALNSPLGRVSGPSLPAGLALSALGTAVALTLSGAASYGQLAGLLAAGLGPVVLLAAWRPGLLLGRGVAPVFVALLGGLWLAGYHYAERPWASALLLGAAPLVEPLGELGALGRRGPWTRAIARSAVAAVPVGVAVAIAVALAEEAGPYPY